MRRGFLGSSYFGDSRLIAERIPTERSLQWNNVVDEYTYAALGTLGGLVVLVLFFIRREEREYLWFSLLLLANALDIGLNIGRLLALIPLPLYDLIDGAVQAVALFAALSFFSIVLGAPSSRIWWVVAGLLFVNPITVYLYVSAITSVGVASRLSTLTVLPASVWILVTLNAAMTVSTIVGALRGCSIRKPSDVLTYLNRVLAGHITGFVACTAALMTADGILMLANAGHLPPYRNGAELEIRESLPLGLMATVLYTVSTFQRDPSETLTFLSDGVVEAQDARGQLFGFDRARSISTQPANPTGVPPALPGRQ